MSKVKIQGHASGTGVLTITAPNTSTDRTITLPDTTGTLLDENSSVPAANLTGTIADARFPATLPAASAANLTAIPAANITGTLPAISGANLTNLPASGITEADQFRLETAFNSPTDGVVYITTGWARPSTDGFGKIGTGMSEAAGVWTFPSTGVWLIMFAIRVSSNADSRYIKALIDTTTDNSSYSTAASAYGNLNPESSYWYTGIEASFMFDVTNVSTHKVKFGAGAIVNDVNINANSDQNTTFVTFIRLGDT